MASAEKKLQQTEKQETAVLEEQLKLAVEVTNVYITVIIIESYQCYVPGRNNSCSVEDINFATFKDFLFHIAAVVFT